MPTHDLAADSLAALSEGGLLAALHPSHGVGVDFSAEMVQRGKTKHPELEFVLADAHDLSALTGNLELDASGVTHLGGLCLQVLLAAAQSCQADGRGFAISAPSDDFDAALSMFGVDPSQLTRNAVA